MNEHAYKGAIFGIWMSAGALVARCFDQAVGYVASPSQLQLDAAVLVAMTFAVLYFRKRSTS